MLSSRGVRLGLRSIHNGKGRPLLGSASLRQYSQLLTRGRLFAPQLSTSPIRPTQIPLASALFQSYRNASTAPTPAAPLAEASTSAAEGVTSGHEWEALIQEVSSAHALQVEPHIGWLKELGLDYGWGPTAVMEFVLEHIQLYSGLPWWAAILATTTLVRMTLIKSFVTAADHSSRMGMLRSTLVPVQTKMREARLAGDTATIASATQELKAMYSAAGIKMRKIFGPMLLQAMFGYGLFRLTAGMSRLPVPGMESGGALWFKDLTMADPTFVLPVLSGVIMWYALKRGGEVGTSSMDPQVWKWFTIMMPGLGTIIFLNFPAGMQFLACLTASWSFLQGAMLRQPTIRRWCGIAPLPPRQPQNANQRYQGTATAYRTPDEIAKSHTIGEKFRQTRDSISTYVKDNSKTKKKTRLSPRELEKAQQYEKERRAEIDAARENYLKQQKRK